MVPSRDDLDSLRLYVSYACPFAHRVLVGMALRGVMGRLRLSVVQPVMGPDGWVLHPSDTEPGVSTLLDVYRRARPGFSRRASVPMLYSVTEKRILSDDSLEILSWIDRLPGNSREGSLFPAQLEPELDRLGKFVADAINSGVYEAGFAANQEAYDQAVTKLFSALDQLEELLQSRLWLCGDVMTVVDIQMFTSLIRFDLVYHTLFKCNWKRASDYRQLWNLARRIYGLPGVADTLRVDQITTHYYKSLPDLNPRGIVPRGPDILAKLRGG